MDCESLIPLPHLARRLRVSQRWLRDEATAGRLPHLRAGRSFLFHAPTVTRLLERRAQREGARA